MKKIIIYARYVSFFILANILFACSGSGNCPTSQFNGIRATLENGAIVTVPVSSLNVAPGGVTSTSITLTGGTPGTPVYFTSNVTNTQSVKTSNSVSESIPIEVIITPDYLVTGTTSSAAMIVKVLNTLSPGTYYIKLFATYEYNGTNVTTQIGVMTIIVGSSSNLGILTITPESINVATNGTRQLVLTLNNSSNVNDMTVELSSSDNAVFTLSPNACVVSTNKPICLITVNGISTGTAYINTSAPNFATQAQATVSVLDITEKGVAAFSPNGYGLTFSDAPSTNNWQSYISGPIDVRTGLSSNAAITSIGVGNNRGLAIAAISGNYTHQDESLPTTGEILVSKNRGQWKPVVISGFNTPVTTILTNGADFYAYGQDGYKFAGSCDNQNPNWHWVCPWWDYNNPQIIWTTDGENFTVGNGLFLPNTGAGIAGNHTQGVALTPSAIGNNQILDHQYDYHSTPLGYQTINGGKNAAVDANGNIWVVSPNRIESNTTTTASVAIYKSSDRGNTFHLESNVLINTGIPADNNVKTLTIQATTIANSFVTQANQQALIFVSQVFGNGASTNIYAIPLSAVDSNHVVNITTAMNPNNQIHGFSIPSAGALGSAPTVTYSVASDESKIVYIVASNFNQYMDQTHIETAVFRINIDISFNLTVGTPHFVESAHAIQLAVAGNSFQSATTAPIISSLIYNSDPAESGLIAVDTNYAAGWGAGSSAGSIIMAVGPNGPNRGNNWVQLNPRGQNTSNLYFTPIYPVAFNLNAFNSSVVATSNRSDKYNDLYFGDTNSNITYSPESTFDIYFAPSGAEQAESQWVGFASNGTRKLILGANGTLIAQESNGTYSLLPSVFESNNLPYSGVAFDAGYLTGLIYANGMFVITTNTNTLYKSVDGLSWTATTIPPQVISPILNVMNSTFIVTSGAVINKTVSVPSPVPSNAIYSSLDLVTWLPLSAQLPINVGNNNLTSNSIFGISMLGNSLLAYGVALDAVDLSNNLLYPNYPTSFSIMTSSESSWSSVQESGLQMSYAGYNAVSYDSIYETIIGLGTTGGLYGANDQLWYSIPVSFESATTQQVMVNGMSKLVFTGKQYVGVATASGFTANLYSTTLLNINNFNSLGFGNTYTNITLY